MAIKIQILLLCLVCHRLLANQLEPISNIDEKLKQISGKVPELDRTIGQIISVVGGDKNRTKTNDDFWTKCYEPNLDPFGKRKVNIFDRNLKVRKAIKLYYKTFPNKKVTPTSVRHLIRSIREIYQHCMQSDGTRNAVKFGFTSLSDKSDEHFRKMRGYRPPSIHGESWTGTRSSGADSKCVAPEDTELPGRFDWRDKNAVTPVRNQRSCNSCYAFSAIATVESALLIAKKQTNQTELDLSEQYMLDCSSKGCNSGNCYVAFQFLKANGTTDESKLPYQAESQNCPSQKPKIVAKISDFCIRGKYAYGDGDKSETITDKIIQQTLVKFGPVAVILNSQLLSKNYKSGVFDDEKCETHTDHSVTLVGYDQRAWIVKNSWGPDWGEQGYFRVVRGKNMCGINFEISFPIV